MGLEEYLHLQRQSNIDPWRLKLAAWVESSSIQRFIVGVIVFNAIILGLETDKAMMDQYGRILIILDKICLAIFVTELVLKFLAYRLHFFRSSWNVFDLIVVGIALIPAAGTLSVLRSLRVLRVLRLLSVIPSLRRVVAAFIHAIPGLAGVMAVMAIFFYTAAVLATKLFGPSFPEWFGSIGRSLYTLFQIMTLESWSMGIVRPVMEVYPQAWAFFVPFIIVATFTILNLFIGVIVSTMQELALAQDGAPPVEDEETAELLSRIEADLNALRKKLGHGPSHALLGSPSQQTSK
jgi:voltage-gated sodium channel